MPRTPKRVGLLCALSLLLSCSEVTVGAPLAPPGAPVLTIEEPADGSTLGGARILVRGRVQNTWRTQVTINDVATPVDGGTFAAWVDVDDGENIITVRHPATGASDTISIAVDRRPPVLRVSNPVRGTFAATATSVAVELLAFDESGLTRLTVAGMDLDPAVGPDWTIDLGLVPGVNTIRVEAEDALGNVANEHVNVLAGPFGDPAAVLNDAVIVHLGQEALRSFEGVVAAAADSLDYTAAAVALNPVVASDLATVNVSKVTLSPGTKIGFRTATDALELKLTVFDLAVDASVSALGLSWDAQLLVPATTVIVPITFAPEAGTFRASLGEPTFDFDSPQITLSDPGGSPPGTAALNGPALESLEAILTQTALAHGLTLLDSALALLTEPYTRTIGGLELAVDLTAIAADAGEHGLELRLSGVLSVGGDPVVALDQDPGPVRTEDSQVFFARSPLATVALSDDLVNTAAYGIWRAGGLVQNVNETVLAGLGESPLLAGFLVGLTDPVGLAVDPEAELTMGLFAPLPPVVGGIPGTDNVGVVLGDVSLTLTTEGQPSVTGFLTIGFTGSALTDDNRLNLVLDTQRTAFDLSIGDPEVERRVEGGFESVVQHLLGELGPLFDALIGSLPVPALGPFQPTQLSVSAGGSGGQYIVLRGALAVGE